MSDRASTEGCGSAGKQRGSSLSCDRRILRRCRAARGGNGLSGSDNQGSGGQNGSCPWSLVLVVICACAARLSVIGEERLSWAFCDELTALMGRDGGVSALLLVAGGIGVNGS